VFRFLGAMLTAGGVALATIACRPELDQSAQRSTRTTVRTLTPGPDALVLPRKDGSVRFAVIGDVGRGDDAQRDVARQMTAWRARFPFDFVVMLGDNIYPPHTPEDYRRKFEEPYAPLLEAGVTFHAAIGNHDDPGQLSYEKFNMNGRRYYSFAKAERRLAGLVGAGVRFFVLDSRSLDQAQLAWLKRELSGHEHFYERIHPQHGITYFVSGAGGALRKDDIRPSSLTAAGFDDDCHFMLVEVSGDELYFQAIARDGRTVDAGVIVRGRDGG
jgi:hypothetical protein